MADVRKTIEVAYQADVTNLLSNLKKIPGMTEEEAKKMVKGLSQQLKQSEKAAKKAANTNSKAMNKMANSAKKTQKQFKAMKRSASEMGRGLGELSSVFGDSDSAIGSMVNEVSLLAMAGAGLIPLMAGIKGAIMSVGASAAVATGGLTLVAGGIALLATSINSSNTEAEEQQKKISSLGKSYKKLSERIEKTITRNAQFQQQMKQTLTAIENLREDVDSKAIELNYKLGTITKKQFEEFTREKKIEASNKRIKKTFDDREKALFKNLKNEQMLVNDLSFSLIRLQKINEENLKVSGGVAFTRHDDLKTIKNAFRQYSEFGTVSETLEETERRISSVLGTRPKEYTNVLAQLVRQKKQVTILKGEFAEFGKERLANEASIQANYIETLDLEAALEKKQASKAANAAASAASKADELSAEQRLAKIAAQKNQLAGIEFDLLKNKSTEIEKINIEIDKQITDLKLLDEANKQLAQTDEQRISTTAAIAALEEKRTKQLEEVNKKIEKQIELNLQAADKAIIQGVVDGYANQSISIQELYTLEDELRNSKEDKETALHLKVMEMIKAEEQARLNMSKTLLGDVSKFTQARLTMIQNQEDSEQKAITKAFYLNQAASAANVAFTTAENLVKALGYGPPMSVVLAASAAAAGAAQMGAIMSQPPPQKKHMGGYIGQGMAPDERQFTLLKGEAVLSRAATKRLGEDGVRGLEDGKPRKPEVIVVSPFKHYDRFIKSRSRRNRTTRKANGGF